jgi:hypothetical protein
MPNNWPAAAERWPGNASKLRHSDWTTFMLVTKAWQEGAVLCEDEKNEQISDLNL